MLGGDVQRLSIGGTPLPFLSYTNFIVEKIAAAAARWHPVDADDILYMCAHRSLDWEPALVRRRLRRAVVRRAAEKHRALAPLFMSMGFSL